MHKHTHTHIRVQIHTYLHSHEHMQAYTHTYTQTHTEIQARTHVILFYPVCPFSKHYPNINVHSHGIILCVHFHSAVLNIKVIIKIAPNHTQTPTHTHGNTHTYKHIHTLNPSPTLMKYTVSFLLEFTYTKIRKHIHV